MLDVDAVTRLVQHVAATVVAPRFRALREGDVGEKGVGDVVTVVDHEAEAALTEGLRALLPGVPVVGEEGVAADRAVLDALGAPRAWVVDPLDGTRAFVEGSPDHAVMVALVDDGVPVAGWVCLPAHGRTYVAERGSGAWCDGRRLQRRSASSAGASARAAAVPDGAVPDTAVSDTAVPDGAVAVWGMDEGVRLALERCHGLLGPQAGRPQRLWSGWEYSRLADGTRDYLGWWRTSPWDHAPGAVITREVGGISRCLDGREYTAEPLGGPLLVAADEDTWATVQGVIGAALRG